MKIVLIRHGATAGNIEKRYIGITDEDLCASGIESIHNNIKAGYYQEVQAVYVSPMKRCRQTAELIYPEYKQHIVPDFRECDFGIFEGKNYKELSGNEQYQRWNDMIKQCRLLNYSDIACVIHGGTIMSVMSEIYGGGYYDYHCGNGDGYICDVALDGSINNYTELLRCE